MRKGKWVVLLVVLLVTSGLAAQRVVSSVQAPPPQAVEAAATVQQVIDGDSVALATGQEVRLLGIDTPEIGQPGGDIAKDMLEGLLRGQKVRLEKELTDKDTHGRLLRWVNTTPAGVCVNAEMVKKGYAIARFYPPDTAKQAEFERLQAEAEKAKRALWAFKVFQPSGVSVVPKVPAAVQEPTQTVTCWDGTRVEIPAWARYIGNSRSGKFHRLTCAYLPGRKNHLYFKTREEALAAGQVPCSVCNP